MDTMFLNCHVIRECNLEKQKIHTHYPYPLHFPDCRKKRGQRGFDLINFQWVRYSIKIDVRKEMRVSKGNCDHWMTPPELFS